MVLLIQMNTMPYLQIFFDSMNMSFNLIHEYARTRKRVRSIRYNVFEVR